MRTTNHPFRLAFCFAFLVLWSTATAAFGQTPEPEIALPVVPKKLLRESTNSNDQIRVAEVLIEGGQRIPKPTVMTYLKTRAGTMYIPDLVQEDARNLIATRQFADVRAQVETLSRNRVNVHYLLTDHASTIRKIEYRGAKHLKDDELNEVTKLKLDAPLNPTWNKLACQSIVRKLNEVGRPFADCHLLKGDKPGDTEVIFVITEGPKYVIDDLQFTGNTFIGSAVLATHVKSAKQILGLSGDLNKDLIDYDVSKLVEYYRAFGFFDVSVSSELQYLSEEGHAVVIFHILEGLRYRLKDRPTVVGVQPATAERMRPICKLQPREYYSGADLDRAAREMEDYLGYSGFDVRVQPVPVWSKENPGVVAVQFVIDEKQK